MANTAILTIKILADAAKAQAGMAKTATGAQKMGAGFKAAAIPAAAVGAGLVLATKAAADDAQAQVLLATSLRNTTGATADQVAAVEDYIAKTALATGVSDDQLRPAMAALARATGSTTRAQEDMAVALDVAAATGKPVETVAAAIAKGYAGQTTALGKLVPGMDRAAVKAGDMNGVMAELKRTTGGAAAAAAGTAAGQMQRFTVAMDETKESIGAVLLPALESIGPVLATVAGFLAQNADAAKPLIIILGAMAVAIWAVNAAMLANPVTWIVIGIAALVAVLVLAYQKSETFRTIVQTAFKVIAAEASFLWNKILKPVFSFLLRYLALVWTAIFKLASIAVAAFNRIKAAVGAAWSWLKTNVFDPWAAVFRKAIDINKELGQKVHGIWVSIKEGISSAWNTIKGIFDSFIGKIQDIIDWFGRLKPPEWFSNVVDKITGNAAAVTIAPAPTIQVAPQRGASTTATGAATTSARVDAIGPQSQVIVQVADRKLVDLIDVQIRASATSAARSLRRRAVVVV